MAACFPVVLSFSVGLTFTLFSQGFCLHPLSTIHSHIHTLTAVSTMQGDQPTRREQLRLCLLLRDSSTFRLEEPGIELATHALSPDLLPPSLSFSTHIRRSLRWTVFSRPLSLYVFLYQYISLHTGLAPSRPLALSRLTDSIGLSLSFFIFLELSLSPHIRPLSLSLQPMYV